MKFLKIVIALTIIGSLISCESETNAVEKQFKKEAQKLIKILNKIGKIQTKKRVVKFSNNVEVNYYKDEKRKSFIEKNKETLLSINKNLEQFSIKYRNSNWADDAAFCRTVAYIFVYAPNRKLFNIEDNPIIEFLDNYNNIQLENWTKDKFDKYYKLFIEGIPADLLLGLSETEIIMNGFHHFLISELCSNGEYQKAESAIKAIEAKGTNEYFINSLKDLMARYKSMENYLKSEKGSQNSLK
jgi:hypothetical protein